MGGDGCSWCCACFAVGGVRSVSEACEINLQWKGTDACYDFYCPCGWEGADNSFDGPSNHEDGLFKQEFQCGGCGRWWHLPNRMIARPGKFFRDDGGYG